MAILPYLRKIIVLGNSVLERLSTLGRTGYILSFLISSLIVPIIGAIIFFSALLISFPSLVIIGIINPMDYPNYPDYLFFTGVVFHIVLAILWSYAIRKNEIEENRGIFVPRPIAFIISFLFVIPLTGIMMTIVGGFLFLPFGLLVTSIYINNVIIAIISGTLWIITTIVFSREFIYS